VVEKMKEFNDSLVVGVQKEGDEQVALFLKMNDGCELTEELIKAIRLSIRQNCSPRHVPAIIRPVDDIPYTINGKKVELAVKKVIHGEEVTNKDALANPEALECFKDIL
jgi:acetoacetyl-CoA synthetase